MAGLATAFGFPYNSQFLLNGHNCCENTTSQLAAHSPQTPHVCSCQLEQVLQHKMSAIPIGLRLPTPGFSGQPNIMFGPAGRDPSTAIYPPLVRQCDIKDMNTGAVNPTWFGINPRFDPHNFDRNAYLACHRFGERFSPIDLNSGARRKNATKETTSTLKAWLYEHRKNPYPTKGEKIMLAILTKMTLTQVSTWFANARRRLKKENKMTWSPRNRCGERKDSEDYSDEEDDHDDDDIREEKTVVKQPEQTVTRTTTVIKSIEGARTSPEEKSNPEQDRGMHIISDPSDHDVVWQRTRSIVEVTQTRTQEMCSLEDSPVKSLRKWVDGCFDRRQESREQSPVTDTPPQTPPSEITERLTEKVSHSTKQNSRPNSRETPRSVHDSDSEKNSEERSQNDNGEGTTNREIDAALALTTLFSRS